MLLSWDTILLIAILLSMLVASAWILVQLKRTSTPISDPVQTIEIFGHRIRYSQEGIGPHIVFVHGIGASSYVWRRLIPLLNKNFTLTTFDLLGFGWSDKPASFAYDLDSQCDVILQFLKKLGIQKCYLVGSSMGGAICLRLAQTHPAQFPKVVTLAPSADPKIAFLDLKPLGFLSPIIQPMITDRFIKQIMKRVVSNKDLINEESLRHYTEPYKNKDAVVAFTKSFSLLRDQRVFQDLDKIQQPILILWGEKDKIIPFKFSKKISAKIKNMIFYSHPLAGHHPHEDEPLWTAEKITQFLTEK